VPANPPLRVPPGFRVSLYASGLERPRVIRVAPNGDLFVSESLAGRIRVLRTRSGETVPTVNRVFAQDLRLPFGIAFYPPGPNPTHVYVAETNRVIRFPYRNGDLVASGPAEPVVLSLPDQAPNLPGGGHWTRDIVFGLDGRRMFISVGSLTNAAEDMPDNPPLPLAEFEARYGRGAAWGRETNRAGVLVYTPDGALLRGWNTHAFATGLRNCTSMTVHPATGALWCANVERDGLGDNLPPDFITRVGPGNVFGWPWFYAGTLQDPRHPGERADLIPVIRSPEVLIQPHSSPLGITVYRGTMFPPAYRNHLFVTLRGSWNRSKRTGYKVVRIWTNQLHRPTGWYEDFLTGFVLNDRQVFGRPVGIDMARDGALLVGEDVNGTIWRISTRP
jgi:glucose/arabinose dehydrogenase